MNCQLSFLPVRMRLPLKFGSQTVDSIVFARVRRQAYGRTGWGETPLSVGWGWPGPLPFALREDAMKRFCVFLSQRLDDPAEHPLEYGKVFLDERLPLLRAEFNRNEPYPLPLLAALICASPFDIALHDAFGKSLGLPVNQTCNAAFMKHDLAWFYSDSRFADRFPEDYFAKAPLPTTLPVWHLVGGKDRLDGENQLNDGYPETLREWIQRDGLKCLKVKLTGTDSAWDLERLLAVGRMAVEMDVEALSADFNCQVRDPEYVTAILDTLRARTPQVFARLIYVEQPFPMELEEGPQDVRDVSARCPLFMDESAHDWRQVRRGWERGWNGVALKVCKTWTGAVLSGCWAREHHMQLMVQDLTNAMLATIPHILLAQWFGTIKGVECNAPQFYPTASQKEAATHPWLYERRHGVVDLSTLHGPGFQWAMKDIQ